MNETFQSGLFGKILLWIFCFPLLLAVTGCLLIALSKLNSFKGIILTISTVSSIIIFSPVRYFIFISAIVLSYGWTSFENFWYFCLLFPIVGFYLFILYGIFIVFPQIPCLWVYNERVELNKVSWGKILGASLITPITNILAGMLFIFAQPYINKPIQWLGPSATGLIKPANGPAYYVFKYILTPFQTPIMQDSIFEKTNRTTLDAYICHVNTCFTDDETWSYILRKQYPIIHKDLVKDQK